MLYHKYILYVPVDSTFETFVHNIIVSEYYSEKYWFDFTLFFHLLLSLAKCLSLCVSSFPTSYHFSLSLSLFICLSRSLGLGLLGLFGLDDRLLPEGSAGLPRRQAAHVLQGRHHPDAVALLHHRGENCGLCPLRLRLPALFRHLHRQPLVRLTWPDAKALVL